MRKFIISVILLSLVVPLTAAQGELTPKTPLPPKNSVSDLDKVKHERDAKISAISAKVQDIEARYYARQVQQGNLLMGTLEENAKSWLGLPEENERFVALVKQYADGPQVPALTPEEMEQLDENKREIRAFLNNGRENPAAAKLAERNRKIRELKEPVFELEARYWAWRVSKVKDTTIEELAAFSQNWIGERAYNQKLIAKIRENVQSGNTKQLTKKEEPIQLYV